MRLHTSHADKNLLKTPTVNYKTPVEYARTAQTCIPSLRSKVYHSFNYFEDRKQWSRRFSTSTAKFSKNVHTNNPNDLNSELFKNNQDHRKQSNSYNDSDLCMAHSVSSHETLRTFPFPIKKKYAKSNLSFFEFAYSTKHSAEKKEAILKDQKHITISLLDNTESPEI